MSKMQMQKWVVESYWWVMLLFLTTSASSQVSNVHRWLGQSSKLLSENTEHGGSWSKIKADNLRTTARNFDRVNAKD